LCKQLGNGWQLFFAVPSLKLLKRQLGLRALGITEVDVAV
jgi:hypothetical protein